MSIFGNILSKIFPSSHPAVTAQAQAPSSGSAAGTGSAAPTAGTSPSSSVSSTPAPSAGAAAQAPANMPQVDVEQVLNGLAQQRGEKLNWRTSIVDLMKLLDLDSSLTARKQLAAELHYGGDTNDSAGMNIWLHKQVMQKLAENGGKVPADLKD